MAGIIIGIISMVVGIALFAYGMSLNNDTSARMSSFLSGNGTEPGNVYIIFGVILILTGLVLLIVGIASQSKKKQTQQFPYVQKGFVSTPYPPPYQPYSNNAVQPHNTASPSAIPSAEGIVPETATVQKAFCPYCGKATMPPAIFCSGCGKKID